MKRFFALAGVALGLVIVAVFFIPVSIPVLPNPPDRAPDFGEVVAMAASHQGADESLVLSICRDTLLVGEGKTPRSFLLLHGLSNCPRQFLELGQRLHARGSNVYIPRMPYHGQKDRLTQDYKKLTLEELAEWTGRALEIARGLGEEVVVVGLSVNGATAAWIAQERTDIARVVILAPFLAPAGTPVWLDPFLTRFMLRLPNRFIWWDRQYREKIPGPPHAYPGFPTRLLGEFMALGQHVIREANKRPPKCRQIVLVLSESDDAISLPVAHKLADRWSRWPDTHIETKIFPKSLAVPHDMIDIQQPNQKSEIVYPALLEIFEDS